MDKDKLRKADIFSGGIIFLAGLFIISQALKMPMKDSWGGVQNVWYVSPAIFPLFVGAMIAILGGLLVRTAIKETGLAAFKEIVSFIASNDFIQFLKLGQNIRFYAIVSLLFSFIFLYIPRIDFFPTAIQFLMAFILMFYLDDKNLLIKLFGFHLAQHIIFILFLFTGLAQGLTAYAAYPGDILMLVFIPCFALYAFGLCRANGIWMKKYKTSLIIAFCAPLIIGVVFKYLLLVPMPFEGMIVELLDLIWYGG